MYGIYHANIHKKKCPSHGVFYSSSHFFVEHTTSSTASPFSLPTPPPTTTTPQFRCADLCDGDEIFQRRMELTGWIHRGYQRDRRCTGAALGPRKRPVLAASSPSVASPASLAPHTPGARPETSCKRDDPWPTSGSERGRRRPGIFSDFQVCPSSVLR